MAKQGEFVFVDGQKIKLDGNGLRTPTKLERQKGLPKSIAEAKAKGLNVYQIPGQPAKIMRYKTRKKADSLGLKAEHENFETRKDNRFGKGGSGKGKRGDAEKLASPDPEVRSKANKKMAEISAKGKVGHHGLLISSYAKGKAEAIAKGGPEAGKLFDQRYASVGLKGGAHSVGNIYEMSHKAHDHLHGKIEPKYYKAIKNAGKNLLRLGIGSAFLNSQSAEAASSILATGANKEDTAKFFKGIGDDLKGQLTIAAASKLLTGNAGNALSGISSKLAPLFIGTQAKSVGDAILRGANGEDLKSQGEVAEAGKKYRKANGWSNGKSDRQNYRHGTSLKVNREMIDDYNLTNGNGDSEFYENYKFNQLAIKKLMRESKKA